MSALNQIISNVNKASLNKTRNYNQVVQLLDSLRPSDYNQNTIKRMKKLDSLLGNISSKLDIVLVGGASGKSLTISFAAKILKEEGYSVGAAYSSHILNYNERLVLKDSQISNKDFTDLLNTVIDIAIENEINATSYEVMTMASLLYFKENNIDIVLLEVGVGGIFDAANFCIPVISVVTRVAKDHTELFGMDLEKIAADMIGISKPGRWFVSAEQSKLLLQKMKIMVEEKGALWSMPIRKLANLPYIYEQLYGRTASLGERIAQIYVENVKEKFSPFLKGNLLATEKGQRGRPTLQAKRNAELNPVRTLKNFWVDNFELLKGRFELLDKEKPTILLDNARNLDSLENLFLGIRLLNYQKSIKGFALVLGLNKNIDVLEGLKLVRYLNKKVGGHLFFIPLPDMPSHDVMELEKVSKEIGLKAKAYNSFETAFEAAKAVVDPRDGLLCITGSIGMVKQYWMSRGIKKIN